MTIDEIRESCIPDSLKDIFREFCGKMDRIHRDMDAQRAEQLEWNAHQEEVNKAFDKRLSDLEFKVEEATAEIKRHNNTANRLYALLDIELAEQAAAMPGSKTDIKCQKRIITLENQIGAAEARIRRAKHALKTAQALLEEAF